MIQESEVTPDFKPIWSTSAECGSVNVCMYSATLGEGAIWYIYFRELIILDSIVRCCSIPIRFVNMIQLAVICDYWVNPI